MCGICGALSFGADFRITEPYVTAMRDTMPHRGPDGAGCWVSPDGRVGLGHRRLAIIDLSDTANQPMANEDGRLRIVFNGEIYNHAAIRAELEARGSQRWRTDHSDTEVILHAFEEWRRKRDFFYATQKASGIGRMIALFFIFFGLFSIFTGGPGGLWLMLIGWFLYSAAQASYQQSTLQETLSGIKVKDIMLTDLKTLSPSVTIDKAVDEYFLRYGYGGFPVIDDGKFLGILTLKEVKNIPREDWGRVKASDILIPHDKKWEVPMDDDVMKALELMIKEDKGRVVVTEKEKIIGLITRNGIARYVQIRGK